MTTITSSVKGRVDARIPTEVLVALEINSSTDELEWDINGKVTVCKKE